MGSIDGLGVVAALGRIARVGTQISVTVKGLMDGDGGGNRVSYLASVPDMEFRPRSLGGHGACRGSRVGGDWGEGALSIHRP